MPACNSLRQSSFSAVLVLLLSCATRPQPSTSPRVEPVPSAVTSHTSAEPKGVDARATQLLGLMSLEEKLSYIGGINEFFIRGIPRLGIPEVKFADGPVGCRNWGPSTAYPATIGLAATFDTVLAAQVGRALARDSRARGVHVLLAPAVNIQRSPLTGRNFEYLGEDPMLAGATATELVKGVQ